MLQLYITKYCYQIKSCRRRVLRGPGQTKLFVVGQSSHLVRIQYVEQEIFVIKNLEMNLLGRPAIQALQLISCVATVVDYKQTMYPAIFKGLGEFSGVR